MNTCAPENRKISQVRHIDFFLFAHVSMFNETQEHLFSCSFNKTPGKEEMPVSIAVMARTFHLASQKCNRKTRLPKWNIYDCLKLSFHTPRTHIPSSSPNFSWLKHLKNLPTSIIYTSSSQDFHSFPPTKTHHLPRSRTRGTEALESLGCVSMMVVSISEASLRR